MDYTVRNTIAGDQTFVGRVSQAMLTKAISVAGETATGIGVSARKDFASRVMKNPLEEAANYARILVAVPAIANLSVTTQDQVSDTNIDTANSDAVWNGYAEKNYRG